MGVWMLDFMITTPKRHILGRNGVFWRILRQNPSTAVGCSELHEPQKTKKTNTFLVRKFTHARRRNALADRDELLHRCRGPRRNHLCRFVLRSLTGFGRSGGSNFWFSPLTCFVALTTVSHYRASVWLQTGCFGQIEYQSHVLKPHSWH